MVISTYRLGLLIVTCLALMTGCERQPEPDKGTPAAQSQDSEMPAAPTATGSPNPGRDAYFGSVPVQAGWSF